eukprot:scaffold24360_cov127-Cylindrotheca_fusiformis.AAC.1
MRASSTRYCTTIHLCLLLVLLLSYVTVAASQGSVDRCPGGGYRPVGGPFLEGNNQRPERTGIECTDDADVCPSFDNSSSSVKRSSTTADRVKVCRTGYHPVTGDEISKSLCIRPERGTALDTCGCCSENSNCLKKPEFESINCTDVVNRNLQNPNAAVVCRDLFNPFTGVQEPETIPIPKHKSLEGDVCGCCGGITSCPTPGEGLPIFERPATTDETCATSGPIECQRRNRTGFFVCRTITNPATGVSHDRSVCVEEGQAWEGDTCGCCGDDCPATRVDLACDQEAEASAAPTCNLKNGGQGNYVCRSLFHPFDGELRNRTFCANTTNAWIFDTCGCCGDCPVEPEAGFPAEEEQWLALLEEDPSTLEDPSDSDADDTPGGDSSGPAAVVGTVSLLGSIVAILVVVA